jgi:D-alanyl-D-alanine carboxypeptidase (penicillin-binding protein 5/6)
VVVGTTSDSVRAQESQKLLNWGYLAYDTVKVYSANQAVNEPASGRARRTPSRPAS